MFEGVVILAVIYGRKPLSCRFKFKRNFLILRNKCLMRRCKVAKRNRVRNEKYKLSVV